MLVAKMELPFFFVHLSYFCFILELNVMVGLLAVELSYEFVIIVIEVVELDAASDENYNDQTVVYQH